MPMNLSDAPLAGRRRAGPSGEIYEDLELWYPKLRLEEAGAAVVVAGPVANTLYHGKHGYPCISDAAIEQMNASDFRCAGGTGRIHAG